MAELLNVVVRHKRYQGREVLKDLHFHLQPGELLSLVGASGCGKSTLLRLIAGLDAEYDGRVTLHGSPVHGIQRDIGFVFQEPRLFPWLTVAENVAFGAPSGPATTARVTALLEAVELSPWAAALPKSLSGGQAQRAAIARGLFRQPRVLLLDEPFSAVDAFTRMKLQDLLVQIVREQGVAVLMVTHDLDEAVFVSDRVLVMDRRPGPLLDVLPIEQAHPRHREDDALAEVRKCLFLRLQDAHVL